MTNTTKTPTFFKAKPIFGFDIGNGSLKVMQLDHDATQAPTKSRPKHLPHVIGYGTANFDKKAIDNGVVVNPELIAQAALELFRHHLIGDVTSHRVAMTIPSYRTFTRSISLPSLSLKELHEAVNLEVEQYIPAPLEDLYLDYEIITRTKDSIEVLAIAVPKKIVDSYLDLARVLDLEVVLIETTLSAAARLFAIDAQSSIPTVIIDFGSLSSDITIFNKKVLATGTVQGGGQVFTNSIKSKLGVTDAEAQIIKTKYGMGLSKKQKEIKEALEPTLVQIVKEIRRMIRYYDERYGADHPIGQLITLGGGANMPGLSDYFTNALRLPVRSCDPWQYFSYKGLQPPSTADKPMYATAAGLSLANPKEVFAV